MDYDELALVRRGFGGVPKNPSRPAMTRRVPLFVLIWFVVLESLSVSADSRVIGVVKTVKGNATIVRNQQVIPAVAGLKLQVSDQLQTGTGASLGVILRDDSVLSLGPESRLVIDRFIFSPREGKLGLLVKIVRGTMAYLSGVIAKLSPDAVKFETPVSTIGIRGTRFAAKVEGDGSGTGGAR